MKNSTERTNLWRRRVEVVVLSLMLAALVALGMSSAAFADDKAETPKEKKSVLIVGDSLGNGIYLGFRRDKAAREGFDVDNRSKVSSGLSRTDFYDWPTTFEEIAKEVTTDYVIVVVGGNDIQALRNGEEWVRREEPEWKKIYRKRIVSMVKTAKNLKTDKGKPAQLFWVGMPVMRNSKLDRGTAELNIWYKEIVEKNNETFVPLRKLTGGENGEYVSHYKDFDGTKRKMRNDDGTHFTTEGYITVVRTIMGHMKARKSKPPKRATTSDKLINP